MSDAFAQASASDASRLAPLVSNRPEKPPENKGIDDDEDQFLDVRVLRTQYVDYLTTKVDEIEEQKDARHYYHGAQWTPEQIEILRRRHQPVVTWNRISRKINGIVGLVERMRSDPKAEPTTRQSENSAEIATHVIRYVMDINEWKLTEPWALLQAGIDGIAGVQKVLTKGDKGDPDIALVSVIGDEYFYDPTSYRPDFSDARYEGISKWLDIGQALELFPDKEDLLRGLIQGDADLTTNADREYKWVISSQQRVRLIEHWYRHKGKWCWAFYVSTCLLDQGLSPFYDDDGNSDRSFHTFSVGIDHDGDRYGFVRNLKGPQDSLNQSRSKALHIANSRRLIMEKGAVDDVETARIQWARPDGVVEVNPGMVIKPDETVADLAAQEKFAQDAAAELDSYANINLAEMAGATQLSGRAIEMLRQPGLAELGPFILAVRGWKLQVYKAIWNTAQRYWTAERWIRVTNDQGLKQFLALNQLQLDQWGRPALVNALGAVDVNITFEEGRDVASVMDDVYDALKGYPPGTFPAQVLIEMSDMPRSDKNKIIQMMQPKPNPLQQAASKLQLEGAAAKNAKTAAEARKTDAMVNQISATADQKRAQAGTEGARAAHLLSQSHLDYASFVRDSLIEAHNIHQQLNAPPEQGSQPAGPTP
jgi:hypothetical protein